MVDDNKDGDGEEIQEKYEMLKDPNLIDEITDCFDIFDKDKDGHSAFFGGPDCDDGNRDDTDACPGTCQDAACGDGRHDNFPDRLGRSSRPVVKQASALY